MAVIEPIKRGMRPRGALGLLLASCLASSCVTVAEREQAGALQGSWREEKAGIFRELGLQALAGGDRERAIEFLSQCVEYVPEDVQALAILARLYHKSGDLRRATHYARTWLDLAPDDVEAHLVSGLIADSCGRKGEALEFFRRAQELASSDDPRPQMDLLLHHLGCGEEERAAAVYAQLRRAHPQEIGPLLARGAWLQSQGRWEDALATLREAHAIAPRDLELVSRMGLSAVLTGSGSELLRVAAQLPARTRLQQPMLSWLLVAAHIGCGDFQAALEELELVAETCGPQPTQLVLEGELYLRMKNLDRAEAAFRHALDLDGKQARARAGLGRILVVRGRFHAALRELSEAAALEPSNPATRALLALCHHADGDEGRAVQCLEQARSLRCDERLLARVRELLANTSGQDGGR